MKEIISTIEVVVDAMEPSQTFKILFKEIRSNYRAEHESEDISFNSYKVINDQTEEYELIRGHSRSLDKTALNSLRAILKIKTDPISAYTTYRNEELIRGIGFIISTEAIFGLKDTELILR